MAIRLGTQGLVGSIGTGLLGNGVVTGTKIANTAIDSEHYVAGSIDAAHLAVGAVSGALAPGDILGTHVANDAIDSEHYAAGSIDAEHFAAGAVDTTALGAAAVTGAKLANNAVDSAHITAGAVDDAHVSGLAYSKLSNPPVWAFEVLNSTYVSTSGTAWVLSNIPVNQASAFLVTADVPQEQSRWALDGATVWCTSGSQAYPMEGDPFTVQYMYLS